MKLNLFKSFVKYYYKAWCVWLAIGIILIPTKLFSVEAYCFFFIIGVLRDAYHFKNDLTKINKLKTRGLTHQDISNIEFVKKWGETRKERLWKYCIKDGGIIAGALLSLLNTMIFFSITHISILQMFPGPGDMFRFIGYAYLSGIILGIIIYRILWTINERRFLRLTDPLNILFSDKEAFFNDLI